MAIGTDLVLAMKDLDNDIDVTADKDQALRAINSAQDAMELIIAKVPDILGEFASVTTTASTETTATPTGFIRFDRLHYIDPNTSRPVWPALEPMRHPGDALSGGARFGGGFWGGGSINATGRPRGYGIYGDTFEWAPLPDATHTVRVYGFKVATDLLAAGTFLYGDQYITPVAAIAVRFFKQQVDDPQEEIIQFAADMLGPVLDQLRNRWKDGYGKARDRYIHTS